MIEREVTEDSRRELLEGQFSFAETVTSRGPCFEANDSREKKDFSFMKLRCSVWLKRPLPPKVIFESGRHTVLCFFYDIATNRLCDVTAQSQKRLTSHWLTV